MSTRETPPNQPGSGLEPNIAGLLCYLLMFFTCGLPLAGIVFLVIEPDDRFVRFHAWQSIFLGGSGIAVQLALWVMAGILGSLLGIFSLFIHLIMTVVGIGTLVLWVICLAKAYRQEAWRIPIIGDFAAKQAKAS